VGPLGAERVTCRRRRRLGCACVSPEDATQSELASVASEPSAAREGRLNRASPETAEAPAEAVREGGARQPNGATIYQDARSPARRERQRAPKPTNALARRRLVRIERRASPHSGGSASDPKPRRHNDTVVTVTEGVASVKRSVPEGVTDVTPKVMVGMVASGPPCP
jgi:hypothetical protein